MSLLQRIVMTREEKKQKGKKYYTIKYEKIMFITDIILFSKIQISNKQASLMTLNVSCI